MFVDGLLEISDPELRGDRENATVNFKQHGTNLDQALGKNNHLSSNCSVRRLIFAPKTARPVDTGGFRRYPDGRVLAVLVTDEGFVENRIIGHADAPPPALVQAGNYLVRLAGKTIAGDARRAIAGEIWWRTRADR